MIAASKKPPSSASMPNQKMAEQEIDLHVKMPPTKYAVIRMAEHWEMTCDDCSSQEGRHYCLLRSHQVSNMDLKRCDDFTER